MSRDEVHDVSFCRFLINFFPIDLALKHLRRASDALQSRVQYSLGFLHMIVSDGVHGIRKLLGELVDWYTVLKRRCEELC